MRVSGNLLEDLGIWNQMIEKGKWVYTSVLLCKISTLDEGNLRVII